MSQLLEEIRNQAVTELAPTEDSIREKQRSLLEAEKEKLAADRQSLADRRSNLDSEESGYEAREQQITEASNELAADQAAQG